MVEESKPDILLLDLGMPVLDGYGTVRKIRENPSFATLPVLAVTAYAMQGDKERILSSGFDGYLSKADQPDAAFPGTGTSSLENSQMNGFRRPYGHGRRGKVRVWSCSWFVDE